MFSVLVELFCCFSMFTKFKYANFEATKGSFLHNNCKDEVS